MRVGVGVRVRVRVRGRGTVTTHLSSSSIRFASLRSASPFADVGGCA